MSKPSTVAQIFVALILSSMLAGMLMAWIGAISRLRRKVPLLPAPNRHRVPWGFGSVLLSLFAWLMVNLVVSWAYLWATGGFFRSGQGPRPGSTAKAALELSSTEQMIVVSWINAILLILIPLLLKLTARARLSDLGIEVRGLGARAGEGIGAFLLITPLVYLFQGIATRIWQPQSHPLEKMIRLDISPGITQLAFLSAVLLAPALEELLFRGVIQGWLARHFESIGRVPTSVELPEMEITGAECVAETTVAGCLEGISSPLVSTNAPAVRRWQTKLFPIAITSLVFAAVHWQQWPAPLAIFFLSLGLGFVYQATGSLVASFVMHAAFNALGTLLLFQAILLSDTAKQEIPEDPAPTRPAPTKVVAPRHP